MYNIFTYVYTIYMYNIFTYVYTCIVTHLPSRTTDRTSEQKLSIAIDMVSSATCSTNM